MGFNGGSPSKGSQQKSNKTAEETNIDKEGKKTPNSDPYSFLFYICLKFP